MRVEFDHYKLRDSGMKANREMAAVPRVGESINLFMSLWIVSGVHWHEPPVPAGRPVARVSIVRPDDWADTRS